MRCRKNSWPVINGYRKSSLAGYILILQDAVEVKGVGGFGEDLIWHGFAFKSPGSRLEEVSTTCGSGWVNDQHAILLMILKC